MTLPEPNSARPRVSDLFVPKQPTEEVTGRNMQVSALALSVGVRSAAPMSGWVVTQLVTQYA